MKERFILKGVNPNFGLKFGYDPLGTYSTKKDALKAKIELQKMGYTHVIIKKRER